jgi:tRNA (cmo5U34)-methyltransferase
LDTLPFVPMARRRSLLERIFDGLAEGGALVVVEKVTAEHAALQDIWLELHWDFKRAQGLSQEMILQKARSLRGVLAPLSLSQNMELLRQAGFSRTDTFVKWLCFAGIVAVKHP